MKQIQEKVKIFCEENKLSLSIEHRVLDTMSEIGELSKEILKASNYGNKPIVLNDKMRLEFGDILFSLITIANSLEIDLDESINQVLEKYQKRIKKNFSPSSNNY
ncbi:MAG: nucleotide pyrophosphohydrolase [Candidatus Marinimicrobia bacterium]|nr:nucleotide pyrophosphohydrolase [Candidatus Neomarinimicrobiota bacterium]|tara:strand:- start:123 stop:437 length:315 start_codon:yes stop_codon:yes gene_type:complete